MSNSLARIELETDFTTSPHSLAPLFMLHHPLPHPLLSSHSVHGCSYFAFYTLAPALNGQSLQVKMLSYFTALTPSLHPLGSYLTGSLPALTSSLHPLVVRTVWCSTLNISHSSHLYQRHTCGPVPSALVRLLL